MQQSASYPLTYLYRGRVILKLLVLLLESLPAFVITL